MSNLEFDEVPPDDVESATGLREASSQLWQRWRDEGDPQAREELICHHLPFARMIAATVYARRAHNEIEFNDYFQLACVGMVEAVDRFRPELGAQFKTFATRRVRGAILDGLVKLTEKNQQVSVTAKLRQERLEAVKAAAQDQVDASPASKSLSPSEMLFRYLSEVGIGIALGVLLEDTGMMETESVSGHAHALSPEITYFRKSEMEKLRAALQEMVKELSARQRMVIQLHYLQQVPFDEIAQRMEVTRARVSQLHQQGLLRLRELLSNDARCDVSF